MVDEKPKARQNYMWIGTLNNPEIVFAEEYLEAWFQRPDCAFVTGQYERGEEGTEHVQYFLHFSKKKSLAALKKLCQRSHFEPVTKDNGAAEYCNKEETRLAGPWTFGVRPARRNEAGDLARRNQELIRVGAVEAVRQGLIRVQEFQRVNHALSMYALMSLQPTEHHTTRGEWFYGVSGSGKSHTARSLLPGETLFLKSQSKWWDGYQGQSVVLLDDLDTNTLGHYLKIWADKYACTGETKGGTIPLKHTRFIVTSNFHPQELFTEAQMLEPIMRRFIITNFPFKY